MHDIGYPNVSGFICLVLGWQIFQVSKLAKQQQKFTKEPLVTEFTVQISMNCYWKPIGLVSDALFVSIYIYIYIFFLIFPMFVADGMASDVLPRNQSTNKHSIYESSWNTRIEY